MKKSFAVLLAMVFMFFVFSMSLFATPIIDLNTNEHGNFDYEVTGWFYALGMIKLKSGSRVLQYGVQLTSLQNFDISYHINSQCAVTYADETQDYEDFYAYCSPEFYKDISVIQPMHLSSAKTVVYVDGEFHVSSAGDEKWVGSIGQTYTPGIDI